MNTPLLQDLRTAREHMHVSRFGAAFGAVPTGSAFVIAHLTLEQLWRQADVVSRVRFWALIPVMLACLLFSVRTIWDFCARFGRLKAGCTIVALEGVMVLSPHVWHAAVALACLVLVNAVATACTLVEEDKPAPPLTVTSVSRELSLPRKAAARVVDRQLAPKPRAAT